MYIQASSLATFLPLEIRSFRHKGELIPLNMTLSIEDLCVLIFPLILMTVHQKIDNDQLLKFTGKIHELRYKLH